jgi:uncharacterized protein DUF5939
MFIRQFITWCPPPLVVAVRRLVVHLAVAVARGLALVHHQIAGDESDSSSAGRAAAIEGAVTNAPDLELCRVNALAFATKNKLDEERTIAAQGMTHHRHQLPVACNSVRTTEQYRVFVGFLQDTRG